MQQQLDNLCVKYCLCKKYVFPPQQPSQHPKDVHLHENLDSDSMPFLQFTQCGYLSRFVHVHI